MPMHWVIQENIFNEYGYGRLIGEVNNINAAGFYKADVQKLVIALNEMEF